MINLINRMDFRFNILYYRYVGDNEYITFYKYDENTLNDEEYEMFITFVSLSEGVILS